MPRKRNPNGFTTDEAQTAQNITDEGSFFCFESKKDKQYRYPAIQIGMCDREALIPASKVTNTSIMAGKEKRIVCPPHLFPPDGKGWWIVRARGKTAQKTIQRLKPLLTKNTMQKWENLKKRCT